MVGLTDEQVARLRKAVLAVLPDTAIIQTATRTPDGGGGWTETWSAAGTVACRLDPLLSRGQTHRNVSEMLKRETLILDYVLTVPHDAPIAPDRRVLVDGVAYEVRALADGHSWRISRRAYVTRVE